MPNDSISEKVQQVAKIYSKQQIIETESIDTSY